MKKKFITLVIAFLMLFSLAACNTEFDLAVYKAEAKAEIANYATESNYCTDNWSIVCRIVDAGKTAVDIADSKTDVDTAVATAKAGINEVRKERTGMFYTLQEAYDKALITVEDLESIAYYRSTEYPESLSAEVDQLIKETRADIIRTRASNPIIEAQAIDISIIGYYGTYNDCIAVVLNDSFTDYPAVMREETIAGVKFVYSGARISIWKSEAEEEKIEETFFSLQEAYDAGFITRDNLMHIAYFITGEVLDSELVKIDFTSQKDTPVLSMLEPKIIESMKTAFYEKHKDEFDNYNADESDITIVDFLGEYNGFYAVQMEVSFISYGEGSYSVDIGGISWRQMGPPIIIFRPTNE